MKTFINYLRIKKTEINFSFKYFCLAMLGFGQLVQVQAQQIFTFDSDATVAPIPDGGYNGNISSMALKEVTVSGIPDGMNYITSYCNLNLTHTWSGDLTVKLFDDNGFAMGLMSRPGLEEAADDGTDCCGTSVDLAGTLIFNDDADLPSENLEIFGNPVPDMTWVRPSKGAIVSYYDTLYDFFGGMSSTIMNGTSWYFGVGDSEFDDSGNFNSATLQLAYDDYCVPRLRNDFEYITNVSFAGINNTTGAHNHLFPAYYTETGDDFATVIQGETYPISVTISPDGPDTVDAFIDWNQNKTFESGETYTIIANTDLPGPFTINIPVPVDAVLGETRMRIELVYSSPTPNPCYQSGWGEIEDYTVVVEEAMGLNENSVASISVYPNPVKDILNITSQKNVDKAEIYNVSGQLIQTEKASNQINMEALPAGIYILKVILADEVQTFKIVKK